MAAEAMQETREGHIARVERGEPFLSPIPLPGGGVARFHMEGNRAKENRRRNRNSALLIEPPTVEGSPSPTLAALVVEGPDGAWEQVTGTFLCHTGDRFPRKKAQEVTKDWEHLKDRNLWWYFFADGESRICTSSPHFRLLHYKDVVRAGNADDPMDDGNPSPKKKPRRSSTTPPAPARAATFPSVVHPGAAAGDLMHIQS